MHEYRRRKKAVIKKDNEKDEIIGKIKFDITKRKYDTALVEINDYLMENPTDYYVLIFKAMVLARQGKDEEAKIIFESLIDKKISKRNLVFAYTQYAQILSEKNQIDKAIEYYNKAIDMSGALELGARGKLSHLYTIKGEYQLALDILDIPGYNDEFLNVRRAYVYLFQKQFTKAIEELDKKTYNDYEYDEIEIMDKKVVEQNKNFIIGKSYFKVGEFDKSFSYLSKALNSTAKITRTFFEINIVICKIHVLQGNVEDAIALCEEMLKKSLSNYYRRIFTELLADSYMKKHDYKKAEEVYMSSTCSNERKRVNLGKIELLKGNFEKAEEHFSCFNIHENDITERYDEFYRLMYIKLRLKKYDEVEEIIDMFEKNTSCYEIRRIIYEIRRIALYVKVVKGEKMNRNNSTLTYTERQIISYDEKEAIEHIKDHHSDDAKRSKFYEGIDIEEMFYDIKNMLTKDNIIYDSCFDRYVVEYNKVGLDMNNGNIHQLRVLTLPDTKNIITMYPYDGTESVINIEEEEKKEKPKVKRLSQIEKFNMRYGNNA